MTSVITRTGKGSALTIAEMDGNLTALNNGKAEATHTHGVADLTATGTKSATTYLRGDNTWATPSGGGGTQFANAAALRSFTGGRLYNVKAEFGGFFDGSVHPLSATYGTLAAAQAAYPLTHAAYVISALTDQHDWCAIQEAYLTAAAAGGGVVALYAGQRAVISRTIKAVTASTVRIEGFPRADIRYELCNTNAAIEIANAYDAVLCCPLKHIDFYALNIGRGSGNTDSGVLVTPGVAVAGQAMSAGGTKWRIGALPYFLHDAYAVVIEGCASHQADKAIEWGDNCYRVTFRDCDWTGGNKGYGWAPTITPNNSGENICFENCGATNNNYGIWNKIDPNGAQGAISIHIRGGSVDYNVVSQVENNDSASGGYYSIASTHISSVYFETAGPYSGANPFGNLSGRVFMHGNNVFHNGGTTPAAGYFNVPTVTSWFTATANVVTGPKLPFFFNTNGGGIVASGVGNRYIDNTPFVLWQTASGSKTEIAANGLSGYGATEIAASGTYAGSIPISFYSLNQGLFLYSSIVGNVSVAIPTDADSSPLEGSYYLLHNTSDYEMTVIAPSSTLSVRAGKQAVVMPRGQAIAVRTASTQWTVSGDLKDRDRSDVSGNYTISAGEYYTRVFASAPCTITLPHPSTVQNREFLVKSFSGANAITIAIAAGTGSAGFNDGGSTLTINTNLGFVRVRSTLGGGSFPWNYDTVGKG